MADNNFYITTPIYYVNDKPHIGHAYTTILADVLTRYNRFSGVPSYFLTGTDEHGQKVKQAAEKAGMTPQQQADTTVCRFTDLWKQLEIKHDDFIRTTEPRHKSVVQKILQDLYDRKEIYRSEYDGWYCITCERFFTERDIVDGRCPEPGCGRMLEKIREANYFFKMGSYQEWLIKYINDNPDFIQPDFRRNETLGFLRKPLNDLCISRPKSRMGWGIELPFDKDYVTYVWFDALVNYISAVGYLSDDKKFRTWWPVNYHLIGKDILTTHTVYWPTMLKAMNLPMPKAVFAHGWWLSGKDKMSKTAGNVVNPMDFAEKYGVDAFRYFLMAEMSLGQDASFTEDAFIRKYNADLANDLGNMLNRVMKLIGTHFDGKIPTSGEMGEEDNKLKALTLAASQNMLDSIKRMKIDNGLAGLATVIREANGYIERTQPWALGKTGKLKELGTVLYTCVEVLRIVSGMMYPVMPGKMMELRKLLALPGGIPEASSVICWGGAKVGEPIGQLSNLFPRIMENKEAKQELAGQKKTITQSDIPGVTKIEYTDFSKVEFKTAKIISAERIEGADKLLKLKVNIGTEQRQIVAGIAKHYLPEELINKTIVVVVNLKPAKLRGVESNGMLLAASSADKMKLVTVDGDIEPGATVK